VVERERGETLADLGAAGDDHDFRRAEIFTNRLRQAGGESRGEFARLDHREVAGGERADQRRERQLQRIVPGRDDADDAERQRHQAVRARPEVKLGRNAPRLHPARHVPQRVFDGGLDNERFGELRFVGRAVAEIGADLGGKVAFVILKQRSEPAQVILAQRERRIDVRARGRVQGFERVEHALRAIGPIGIGGGHRVLHHAVLTAKHPIGRSAWSGFYLRLWQSA